MTPSPRCGGFEGDLAALSVVEIVQTLNLGGKTARVVLRSSSGTGVLWFRDGAMIHAATGSLFGEPAVFAIVEWTSGRFLVEYGLTSDHRSISGDTTQILLDALRRLDERSSNSAAEADRIDVPPVLEADVRRSRLRRSIVRAITFAVVVVAIVVVLLHEARSRSTAGAQAAMPVEALPSAPSAIAASSRPARRSAPSRPRQREKPVVVRQPPAVAPESPLAEEPVPNVLLQAPEPAPKEAPVETAVSSRMRITGRSGARGGTLVVLVDGAPVFTHDTLDENEPFEAEVAVTPGEHVIVARLEGGAQAGVHEDSTRALFAGGEARSLRVTANRLFGSPVKVKIGRAAL